MSNSPPGEGSAPGSFDWMNPARSPVSNIDIAREAGVSAGLVSAFFSGNYYRKDRKRGIGVGEASRQKIRDACMRLNYVPEDPFALYQVYPDRADVAFMLNGAVGDGFANPYHSLFFEGFARRAFESKVDMNSLSFHRDLDYESNPYELPNVIQRGAVRKVALCGGRPNPSLLRTLLRLDASVVCIGAPGEMDGVVSVSPDFEEAGRLGVRTLAEHGHRRFVAASVRYMTRSSYSGALMWDGYVKAKEELGLPISEDELILIEDHDRLNTVDEAVRRILDRDPQPTAVFCFDDPMARTLAAALMARGISVPRDFSIMGCNDDRINQEMRPAQSTIHLPCRRMGARAYDELTRVAVEGRPAHHERIVMHGYYVDRGTIGPVPQRTNRIA